MAAGIPEIEVADDADAACIGRQHDKAHTVEAIQRHRMRAQLVVETLMRAFAQQIQIEIGQKRRKSIGIVQVDDLVAEACAQLVFAGRARERAREQPGIMDARQDRSPAILVDRRHFGRLRQKGTNDRPIVFGVRAEIVERIRVTSFDDGVGFRRQSGHGVPPAICERICRTPVSGTRIQSGRCAISYSIS